MQELANRKENLSVARFGRYIRCDLEPADSAHALSNWWGVRQTVEAWKALLPEHTPELPQPVRDKLRQLGNKKVLYFYGTPSPTRSALPTRQSLLQNYCSIQRRPENRDTVPKVAYLDDEAALGWAEVLRAIFYGNSDYGRTHFLVVNQFPQTIDKDWLQCAVLCHSPDLVLLDLRLRGSFDLNVPVSATADARVAQLLRELAPGLPAIVLTASNKAWTFEEMMKLAVDAYWAKEGVGDHSLPFASAANYSRLVELAAVALREEYQFLRRLADTMRQLQIADRVWWSQFDWPCKVWQLPRRSTADRDQINTLLTDIVLMLRHYLHLFHMGYGFKAGATEEFWHSSLIVQMAKAIEIVHCYGELPRHFQKAWLSAVSSTRKRGGF